MPRCCGESIGAAPGVAGGPARALGDAVQDGDAEAQGRLHDLREGSKKAPRPWCPRGRSSVPPPTAVSHVGSHERQPWRAVAHWPELEERCRAVLKILGVKATGAGQRHLVTGRAALMTLPCWSLWGGTG